MPASAHNWLVRIRAAVVRATPGKGRAHCIESLESRRLLSTVAFSTFGFGLSAHNPYGQSVYLLEGNTTYLTSCIFPTDRAYIACVFSPSGADIYINGQHALSVPSFEIGADSSGNWAIGVGVPDGSYEGFTGSIDDVAVYNYRVSADQLMRHYMIGVGYSNPS